ncbi:MAG: S41 family peptidase, partial [Fimbriimonas sp.]
MRFASSFALVALAVVSFAQETPSTLTRPDIHGDLVVFTAEGDLWLGDLKTNDAKRLTNHEGNESFAKFSPDGGQIAFTASYDGSPEVYVMPTGGGAPKRLTYERAAPVVQDWSPDGKSILYRVASRDGRPVHSLYSVPAGGGLSQQFPIPQGEFGSLAPDGRLAYVPQSNEWANWFRYKAGSADDVWLYTPSTKAFERLTDWEGVDTSPVWANNQIYFVSERSGNANLWSLDPKSKKVAQISKNTAFQVRYPGSDGKSVVFQAGPTLAVLNAATGEIRTLKFRLDSDRIHEREQRIPITPNIKEFAIGPTGKRGLIQVRGQILSVATEEGDVRVLENQPGTRAVLPAWSADGKRIAFISDRTGENEIWTTDGTGGAKPKQLTTGFQGNALVLKWSPDGKWIAVQDRAGRTLLIDATNCTQTVVDKATFVGSYDTFVPRLVFSPDSRLLAFARPEEAYLFSTNLYELETKKLLALGHPGITALSPAFSPDGKFLAYLTVRALNPAWSTPDGAIFYDNNMAVNVVALTADATSPFLAKNEEEGEAEVKKEDPPKEAPKTEYLLSDFESRTIAAPVPAGRYSQIEWTPGRFLLLSTGVQGLEATDPGDLQSYNIEKKSLTTLASGVTSLDVAADRKHIAFNTPDGVQLADSDSGSGEAKPLKLGAASITYLPREEWRQIFNESWRLTRDLFYDPGMHGVDWAAIRTKYAAMLPSVGDRTDLHLLLRNMLSELNSGHAYAGNPAPYGTQPVPKGYLGADYEPAATGVRITKLYRGDFYGVTLRSPLLEPGLKVKEGDYILAVDGAAVRPDQDIQALLVGKVGQVTAILVNDKPTTEGARIVRVKPLASEAKLRYQEWVLGRAAYVAKNGGPNFGYAHVIDMGAEGYIGFSKSQQANAFKDAVVYDFRYNGGGNISSVILNTIRPRPTYYFNSRNSEKFWTREGWNPSGYVAALCNEDNFSDGELVIEGWKKLGLGPVVGKRTGGGEVGSGGGYRLIDDGTIFVPNYGAFDHETGEWVIEGVGAKPDYEVNQDPAAVMAGRDPQ